ncbi:NAD(P)-dependent oxidoreductase [Streptomyces filipinensis]|uniref:NAD(P)-dependent oxidoreductase n=1 Tax=Streptomyces filipinensis TaxID=66887 RepID=A0A918MAI7_9ACTN|nr:SDR family oxidoreductase [Streptomyces filipinensis]GGU92914.1 NAD(P)-dependent oxidoreductase [Streptomyces filipinensis]
MILVTGASGNVGTALLARLRSDGVAARAAYRDPRTTAQVIKAGGQAVTLDLDMPDTIGPALDGIETVFLLGATSPAQTTHELNMLAAARVAGVRVVKLSVWRADEGLSPIARLHQPVEQALVASGLPWTILRPNFYLQNFLRQPSIREAGEFSFPLITAPISFIDIGDIARVAAKVLATEGHDGCVYDLTGPKALTYTEAADEFSDVLGKPVRYVGLPDAEARAAMLRRGMPGFSVDALMGVARAYRTGGAETVTPTVADLTGRAPLGFADFVRQNRHFFD